MEEPPVSIAYTGEERRRRWPSECPGEERRKDALAAPETDQEPDQSPLSAGRAADLSISGSPAARR